MYVVGFNGPPQCGKDTLAKMVADAMDLDGVSVPVITRPLSYPLRLIASQMAGVDYNPLVYEMFKGVAFSAFGGVTGRQLMIDVSEKFLKPTYGADIMARLFFESVREVRDTNTVVLVPDCGFGVEVSAIHGEIGSDNFYLVRVHRPGVDFSGDSRELAYSINDCDVENCDGFDELADDALTIVQRLRSPDGMNWQI